MTHHPHILHDWCLPHCLLHSHNCHYTCKNWCILFITDNHHHTRPTNSCKWWTPTWILSMAYDPSRKFLIFSHYLASHVQMKNLDQSCCSKLASKRTIGSWLASYVNSSFVGESWFGSLDPTELLVPSAIHIRFLGHLIKKTYYSFNSSEQNFCYF